MKPPLTPMITSPGSIPALAAGPSGTTSIVLSTRRPVTLSLLGPEAKFLEDRTAGGRSRRRAWCRGSGTRGRSGRRFRIIRTPPSGLDVRGVEPVRECPVPASLSPGVEISPDLAPLGRDRVVARPAKAVDRRENVDVDLVAGRRGLHPFRDRPGHGRTRTVRHRSRPRSQPESASGCGRPREPFHRR